MSALFTRLLLVAIVALLPSMASAQGMRVLARVNDDAITDFDLQQRVLFAIRTTGLQDSPDLRQRMAPQMLRQMIDEKLQIQDAKRLGLKAQDAEVAQRYADIERGAGMARGQFKQYLQSVGVSSDVASQQIEAQISWNKIIRRKVRPMVDVSEAEIDDALNRARSNAGKTESRVAEIFVPVDRADMIEDAKRSADRIVEQLKHGAPFGAVAQQFSQGSTASGDLTGVRVGDLQANPQMFEQLPKLAVGATAGPFRVAEGLQVVALCSKVGADGLPTRDAISQQILIQKMEAAGRRYMRDLRRQATIEMKRPA